MSVKKFNQVFGIESSLKLEQTKFINRVENEIFNRFDEAGANSDHHKILFKRICYEIGENFENILSNSSYNGNKVPNLTVLTDHDFIKTMRVLVAFYQVLYDMPEYRKTISEIIPIILDKAEIDLGVKWYEGVFYPSGEDLLDNELIEKSFVILDGFENEKKDLMLALKNYQSKSLQGVIENCFRCVEGISRKLLGNTRTLDKNKEDLMRLLNFSEYWNKIFFNFLKYAHEYGRHAGEKRHDLKPVEVEAYLYLTCLIIRSVVLTNETYKQ